MSKKAMKTLIRFCKLNTMAPAVSSTDREKINGQVIEILENEDVNRNLLNRRGKFSIPLCEACRSGNEEIIAILLQYRADPNVYDKNKCTPLYIASSLGYRGIVEKLLETNADVNAKNEQGYVPLLSAIENNHFEIAEILMEHGADVNIKRPNTFGIEMTLMTFVLFAKNNIPLAEKLLEAGVNPHVFEKPLNFILLEYGDECRRFIKKLVYAGYSFYCDAWVRLVKSKLDSGNKDQVTESELEMLEFLNQEHYNACSLQKTCRTVIRTCLSGSRPRDHISSKISCLPLPTNIKRYLALEFALSGF
ncbi:26S proteasome non-ATPase regulatory subunit 10-like [Gigantopelta aegis]|uniref:26S proteasome non-ATPase regulatory subunit 10-like n=1 Tax=Gigantopelta aegis TaxID=1735272 RepID=UPI001B88745A|nr:26S proteasome non-ATPase regulatory subunit 10-like [Gigantopelta aegis]XP_041374044.1 26S proteasome non-ATPase regulatory subunit 10-like [Gigantopelta aegis]